MDDVKLLKKSMQEARKAKPDDSMDSAIQKCSDWFRKDRSAKQTIIDEWDEIDKLYECRHWDLKGPSGNPLRTTTQQANRPNAVEPIAFALIDGLISEFAQDVELVDIPSESGDEQAALLMTDLKKFIAYKNRIQVERLHWLFNFFWYGAGGWEHVWDPNWKGGKGPNKWIGEVRWRSINPRNIFPDARCGEDINNGHRLHKAVYVTLEHLHERYGEQGKRVQSEAVDEDFVGLDSTSNNNETSTSGEAQEDMALLIETWYFGEPFVLDAGEKNEGPGLHCIWWAGESQQIYLKHANYIYFEPGETVKFPFTIRNRYRRKNSVWGYGEAHFLKQTQIMRNKTAEIIMEANMHHALGQTFFHPGAVSPQQKKFIEQNGTLPGLWAEINDINGVKRVFGQGVPPSVQAEASRLGNVMETVMGRFDISQGKTPGSVTAFRALDLLAQRAQVRLRAADVAITTGYEDAGTFINRLVLSNYTERRTYRIVGKTEKESTQYGEVDIKDIQKVYFPTTGQVIPFKDFQEPPEGVEGPEYEIYSPDFDVVCRTSTSLPSDRMFYMEVAKELFGANRISGKTFLYVIENGKFPPWEEVAAEMDAMTKGMVPSGAPSPSVMPELEALLQDQPELLNSVAALSPEDQIIMLEQLQGGAANGVQQSPAV